ncbi:CARDB protein [Myxococcus fulvus]|uniref:CARDB protein n=2 Tax=Myxococcus fulvus TaxID=33 RepID=A0ABY1BZ82_MYXFU|nr:CARDB protein [Myxococcus fulvus]
MKRPEWSVTATSWLVMGLFIGVGTGCSGGEGASREPGVEAASSPLQTGPDLVIRELRVPASVRRGQDFNATVTVCNQGSVPVSGVRTRLFMSVDDVLTPSGPQAPPPDQLPVGDFSLSQTLTPGACVSREVSLSSSLPPLAQQDGAYYVGAIVDDPSSIQELREDNNSAVQRIGVGNLPDLVITELRAPVSVMAQQMFEVQARVCNQGTTASASTRVSFLLSVDDVLTPSGPGAPPQDQVVVGSLQLPWLEPGQCLARFSQVGSWLPPSGNGQGRYVLGAIVDDPASVQELREDNNTHASTVIGVGSRADLVVRELSSPASFTPGQSTPVRVTVCNQGTQSSGWARFGLYLSLDDVLTPMTPPGPAPVEQVQVGMGSFPSLAPGQCLTREENVWPTFPPAPTEATALYLGAIVDDASEVLELREDNNAFVKGLVGLGHRPDLVVTDVQVPPSLSQSQSFQATVTVCNQGTQSSNPVRAQLYLSTTPTLSPMPSGPAPLPPNQSPVGEVQVSSLVPGQCATRSLTGWPMVPPGATGPGPFYVGAAVDDVNQVLELREDNNTFVKGLVGVGNGPDLVITAMTAPPSLASGQPFQATVTVCNQGTQPSNPARAQVYLSMDTTLTRMTPWPGPSMPLDQTPQGEISVPSLSPGACLVREGAMPGAVIPPDGTGDGAYYLGAIVDDPASVQELREDNNAFILGRVGVGLMPDLVVTALGSPESLPTSGPTTVTVTMCNQGTRPSNSTQAQLFVSSDAVLSPMSSSPGPAPMDQVPVGSVSVPSLGAGQCTTRSIQVWASIPPDSQGDGVFFLGAIVDEPASVQELREDNNSFVKRVGVGQRPDLVITAMTAPRSVGVSLPLALSVNVCNRGTLSSPPSTARVYLSTDAVLTTTLPSAPPALDQVMLGSVDVPALAIGQCLSRSLTPNAWLPPEAQGDGAYYLGAIVDETNSVQELREDNNVFIHGLLGVGSRSDLVVTAMTAPASAQNGQSLSVTVTVCNHGTMPSPTSSVRLLLSVDDQLSASPLPSEEQQPLGNVDVPALAVNQCLQRSATVSATVPPGLQGWVFHLGAIVDAASQVQELREDNNTFVHGLIGIGARPDLVVSSLTGPVSAISGSRISATVRVCNQGTTASASSTVTFVVSLDTSLAPEAPVLPGGAPPLDQVPMGGANIPSLAPGACITQSVPNLQVSLPPDAQGAPGARFLGAYVDSFLAQQELREDNNTRTTPLTVTN